MDGETDKVSYRADYDKEKKKYFFSLDSPTDQECDILDAIWS